MLRLGTTGSPDRCFAATTTEPEPEPDPERESEVELVTEGNVGSMEEVWREGLEERVAGGEGEKAMERRPGAEGLRCRVPGSEEDEGAKGSRRVVLGVL